MTILAVPLDGSLSRLLLLPPWKLRSSLRLPHSVPSLSSGHLPYRRAHWHLLALTLLDSLRLNDSFKVTPLTLRTGCKARTFYPVFSVLGQCQWSEAVQVFPSLVYTLSPHRRHPTPTPRSSSCFSPFLASRTTSCVCHVN